MEQTRMDKETFCAQVIRHQEAMFRAAKAILKQDEDATTLQAELDAEVFARRIAPALHIMCRFAGQEPLDPSTARYNDAMRRILPAHGIAFYEIPRITLDGAVISASRVRAILTAQGVTEEVLAMVPESIVLPFL